MLTIIYFILILSVIVVVHELGHLIVAKIFKVYCYEFSIGMGPKLFSKQFKETKFCVRALPIGGFVSMAGENSDDEKELYPNLDIPSSRTLKGIKPWKKILIMLAGVFMNFMLCWIIFSGMLLSQGYFATAPEPVVAEVIENSPAQTAGVQQDDRILKVTFDDGTVINPKSFYDILVISQTYSGKMNYTLLRDGKELEVTLQGVYNSDTGTYQVGIGIPDRTLHKVTPLNCLGYGAITMNETVHEMLISLGRLIRGNGLDQLSGPVGIYQTTAQQAALGVSNLIYLLALLSLNVGIFNLIPIPMLDGGRVVITLGEWVAGKPLNKKVENALMGASVLLMIVLMVFATWQDIARLFS